MSWQHLAAFQRVVLAGITPPVDHEAVFGVTFGIPAGQVVRLSIGADDIAMLLALAEAYLRGQPGALIQTPQFDQALALYRARQGRQSSMFGDKPSAEGLPHEGQNVAPPATSSAACAAETYEPRSSFSHITCQRPFGLRTSQKGPLADGCENACGDGTSMGDEV